MSSLEIHGTVTQRSNGVIRITPAAGSPASRLEIREAALGSKLLPDMGDDVTVSIAVTQPVETERTPFVAAALGDVAGTAAPLENLSVTNRRK